MIDRILDKLGIELNDMQQDAMQAVLHTDRDVVVLSPTGSGKTLAYLLPLSQLIDAGDDEPQAIVVTPGRELALQSATVLKNMGSGLRAMACYGGRATMDEHRVMKQVRPQIVFGTPGRLNDHLDKGNLNRYHIRYLVIDEFDKCLEIRLESKPSAGRTGGWLSLRSGEVACALTARSAVGIIMLAAPPRRKRKTCTRKLDIFDESPAYGTLILL